MRKRTWVLTIVAAIAALSLIIFAISSFSEPRGPWLLGKLFTGNHITFNIKMEVNGKEIPLTKDNMTCSFEETEQKVDYVNGQFETKWRKIRNVYILTDRSN